MPDKKNTLEAQTEAALNNFMSQLSPEVQKDVGGAFERLMASDAGAQALNVGEIAPNFKLPSLDGEDKQLSGYLADGDRTPEPEPA